MDKVVKHNKLY